MPLHELEFLSSPLIAPFYQQNLFWIFVFYGLALYGVASAILFTKKQGDVELINDFDWLAAFAILRGTASLATAAALFVFNATGSASTELEKLYLVLLIAAYLALLEFAIRLSFNRKEKIFSQFRIGVSGSYFHETFSKALKLILMVGSVALVISLFVLSKDAAGTPFTLAEIEIFVTRSVGVLAALGATLGFVRLGITMKQYFATEEVVISCWLMALAFAYYAVFEAALSAPIYGIPIQVYRLVFTFLAAHASIRMVRVLSVAPGRSVSPPSAKAQGLARGGRAPTPVNKKARE